MISKPPHPTPRRPAIDAEPTGTSKNGLRVCDQSFRGPDLMLMTFGMDYSRSKEISESL